MRYGKGTVCAHRLLLNTDKQQILPRLESLLQRGGFKWIWDCLEQVVIILSGTYGIRHCARTQRQAKRHEATVAAVAESHQHEI